MKRRRELDELAAELRKANAILAEILGELRARESRTTTTPWNAR